MRFKRILLKLSGESLAGDQKQGINVERLNQYAEQIKEIASMGCPDWYCYRWRQYLPWSHRCRKGL